MLTDMENEGKWVSILEKNTESIEGEEGNEKDERVDDAIMYKEGELPLGYCIG